MEDLTESFNITDVQPVFIDHSGFVIWILDKNNCMYEQNEMMKELRYLGSNLIESLTNNFIHPDNIYIVIKDNGEHRMEEQERRIQNNQQQQQELMWEEAMWQAKKIEEKKLKKNEKVKRKVKKNKQFISVKLGSQKNIHSSCIFLLLVIQIIEIYSIIQFNIQQNIKQKIIMLSLYDVTFRKKLNKRN